MMEFLDACDPEWMEIWHELAQQPLNCGDPICVFMGKSWEYMGSTDDHHHLRHPKHPRTGKVEYVYLERRRASFSWAAAV